MNRHWRISSLNFCSTSETLALRGYIQEENAEMVHIWHGTTTNVYLRITLTQPVKHVCFVSFIKNKLILLKLYIEFKIQSVYFSTKSSHLSQNRIFDHYN